MDKVVKITVEDEGKITKIELTESVNGSCVVKHLPDNKFKAYPSVYEAGGELLTDILR